jgi:hypothetical protein
MQIDATVLSMVVSALSVVIVGLARFGLVAKEKDIDRRIDNVVGDVKMIDVRLHTEEKATIRQDGNIRLVEEADTRIREDLDEIKLMMARKEDIRAIERSVETMSANLMREINNLRSPPRAGQYGYQMPSGQMHSPEPKKSDR